MARTSDTPERIDLRRALRTKAPRLTTAPLLTTAETLAAMVESSLGDMVGGR